MMGVTDGLLHDAEWIRVEATLGLSADTQASRGQYFTPERAASLIASMPVVPDADPIRILDPGAGSGILTAAVVERLVNEVPGRRIEITAIDIDPALIPTLQRTADLCCQWAQALGTEVSIRVIQGNVISLATGLDSQLNPEFDIVIMNPPYMKLGAFSQSRRALSSLGWDAPNLYCAFLAIGVEALKPGGQLVAITPRSFANGPYFAPFRKTLLREVAINRLHTFESRSSVFSDTGVLQENVVFSATKHGKRDTVLITASHDHTDKVVERLITYDNLVSPSDPGQFIRITTDAADDDAVRMMAGLPSSLSDLGLAVSTGRVVDFRARSNLVDQPTPHSVPLVYPGNLHDGQIRWPYSMGKPQGFVTHCDKDCKSLMPPGCYVLVKRFSAKEERRRIVAALWTPEANVDQPVAFENHLNVFHVGGEGVDPDLGWGLCLWLNSTVVDRYFRTFSGHTQVNATDLRSLRYPDVDMLCHLARMTDVLPDQDELDSLVDQIIGERVTV